MVREINQIDALSGLRAEWTRLLAETPGATFFQSLEWLESYWRHYAGRQRLRVVVVERAGQPTGIVPWVVRPDRTRVGRLRLLTWPLDSWGSFYGPIGPRPAETLAAALEHLQNSPRDWDAIDLRWQGTPGADLTELAGVMRRCGYQGQVTQHDETAVIELAGTWDEYLAARPKLWRRNFRAAERRLFGSRAARPTLTPNPSPHCVLPSALPLESASLGQDTIGRGELVERASADECNVDPELPAQYVRYRLYGPGDPRWDLYEACEEVAARSWQAAAKDGTTLSHHPVRAFLRDAHAAAAAVGAVDLSLLYVGGQPAAFIYNYAWRGSIFGLRLGYDPQFSAVSPGLVLFGLMVRDSFARGDRLIDLGIESAETKQPVQTGRLGIYRLSHYPAASLRAQLLRVRRWWLARQTAAK